MDLDHSPVTGRPAAGDVGQPLMQTKLDPPTVPTGMVERPGLLERLTQSQSRITLIEAPAGWGKTSLLAAWISDGAEPRPFAFLRLGRTDNDTRTFWAYVVAAMRRVDESLAPDVDEGLRLAGIDPTRSVIPALVNSLAGWGRPVVLVLDDYHLITETDVHRSVEFLVEHAPANLMLVVSSRSDPPFAFQRHRVSGDLTEVRLEDLRLSPPETQQFFASRFELTLGRADAETLCAKTEGWPAGIQLAALSCSADRSPSSFISSFSGSDRNVVDYLTSEVLGRLPDTTRSFLLRSSFLDEFNVDLCNSLLESSDAAETLDALERDSMFLVPLDSSRTWFRYHHLFRDWLRHTQRRHAPSEIPDLHRRAAAWFETHRMHEQAIDHLLAAGDIESAAELVDAYLHTLPYIYHAPVQGWFDQIPDDVAADHPAIVVALIFRSMTLGDFAATQRWSAALADAVQGEDDTRRQGLLAYGRMYRGIAELFAGDPAKAEAEFAAIDAQYPAGSQIIGTLSRGLLGVARFVTTGPEESVGLLREGSIQRRRLSIPDGGITSILAAAYAELGQWPNTEAAAAEALEANPLVEGAVFPSRMGAHYALGQLLHHQGRVDDGIAQIQLGLDEAKDWAAPADAAWGHLLMSKIVREPARTRRLLAEASRLGARGRFVDQITAAERRLASGPRIRNSSGVILDELTPRELDVLRLLRGDLSLREIGGELDVSHNTIKGYTKTIYQKLSVSSREGAVETALEAGLL